MKTSELTEKDFMVINYLNELSRTHRLKLLFIFEDVKNTIMQDEAKKQMEQLIDRVKL
jgi:hypothetical protein